jgi:hypothetical protein
VAKLHTSRLKQSSRSRSDLGPNVNKDNADDAAVFFPSCAAGVSDEQVMTSTLLLSLATCLPRRSFLMHAARCDPFTSDRRTAVQT